MKIELSVKSDYLPKWGVYEGIRELLQNGKDAETEFGAALDVRHREDTNTLVIENEGASLPHEALLFGHTTKESRGDLIGHFGEGLKAGTLALVRAGCPVKVRSGSELWEAAIVRSEKFHADVLCFEISKNKAPKNRVQVEIGNINKEAWELIRPRFLFLSKPKKGERIECSYGALLTNEDMKGSLFVKGIFVEKDPKLLYGYDLTRDVDLDRDRRMIQRWDLDWRLRNIWVEAITKAPALTSTYVALLEEGAADIGTMDAYSAGNVAEPIRKEILGRFHEVHGKNAVPVGSLADSKDIEHLGKKGVVVSKNVQVLLETLVGPIQQLKAELANEVTKTYGWSELSESEKANLESAIQLVSLAEPVGLGDLDIAEFRSAGTLGLHKDGHLFLAKSRLESRAVTLETLVHEVAHKYGGDGDHRHVANMERIWSAIVEHLRQV